MKNTVAGSVGNRRLKRYLAWLLTTIIVWGTVTPGFTSTASTDRNWEVMYEIGTDEGIPLSSDDDEMRIHVKAGEALTFYMTLMERSAGGRLRFQKEFNLYLPDELYQSMVTENGDVFESGWLESDVTECGYLMDVNLNSATPSNATSSNRVARSGRIATESNLAEDAEHKITFSFTDELKKVKNPATIEIEEVVGSVDFCLENDSILVVTQDGNDCRITMEEPEHIDFGLMAAQNMMVYLEIKDSNGSFTDIVNWKPDYYKEEQVITLRVNYTFDKLEKTYEPGELKIEIESLLGYLSEATAKSDRYTVAANQPECYIDCDGWVHDYDAGQSGMITFTNEETVDVGVDGYFEIQWTVKGTMIPDEYTFQAVVKDEETEEEWKSNECVFVYEKDKKSDLNLSKRAVAADTDEVKQSIVNLPDNYKDFYWVKYYLNAGASEEAILFAEYKLEDQFPAGCIVYDESFKKVDNDFEVDGTIRTKTHGPTEWSGNKEQILYVGYPKSQYQNGELIENTAYLHARYEDMDEQDPDAWVTKEASCQLQLADFNFTYTGDLYAVTKSGQPGTIRLYETKHRVSDSVGISYGGDGYNYYVRASAKYTGRPMNLIIGDDLLYISRSNGTTTKLEDGEYRFTHISIPEFPTEIGSNLVGYRFKFEVRLSGNDYYETYDLGYDTIPVGNPFHNVPRNIDIVAWRLTVYDVDQTINSGIVYTGVDVFTENVDVGELHNFDYLQVYIDGELQNAANISNYSSYLSSKEIAAFDIDTYGNYLQRATYKRKIIEDDMPEYSISKTGALTADGGSNKSEIRWNIKDRMEIATGTPEDNYLDEIVFYDLLPAGVTLREQNAIVVSEYLPISSAGNMIKLKSGRMVTKPELNYYFEERTVIDVVNNYKDSGRTKVTIKLDLTDDPIDLRWLFQELWRVSKRSSITWLNVNVYTEITDEDVYVYGNTIKNYVYGEAKTELESGVKYKTTTADNGVKANDEWAADINENGDEKEKLPFAESTVKVPNPGSSVQSLKKLVQTSQTKHQFVAPYGKSGLDEEYAYRLRIKTGNHPLGNIIIYDTIERIVENGVDTTDGWYGYLQGFDTGYAESLGFAPVIYYSTSLTPNPLSSHPGEWVEYDETTITDSEKNSIKTIAFDLRYDSASAPVNLGANKVLYVDVHMKAPASLQEKYAMNRFYTEWTKLNPDYSPIGEESGLTSNIVKVDLEDLTPPQVTIDLTKVNEHGDPIVHDTAEFGIFYDSAAVSDAVKDENGNNVTLTTDQVDAKATVSFELDESKSRYDGSNTYYMLYLRETKNPAGYYGLGGTKEHPTNQYIIKIKLVVEADGSYSIQTIGENPGFSTSTIGKDSLQIKIMDYRKPVKFDLKAWKEYYDADGNQLTTLPEFDFKLTLESGNKSAVTILQDVVHNSKSGAQALVLFEDIMITEAGEYKFRICEIAGDNAEIKYDSNVIDVIVTVKVDDNGDLILAKEIEYTTPVIFRNDRLSKVSDSLRAYKTLAERPLKENEFSFEAKFVNGKPIKVNDETRMAGDVLEVVKNTGYGLVEFSDITFFQDGSYLFKITEKQDSTKNWIVFDEHVYYAYIVVKTDPFTQAPVVDVFEYYEADAIDLAAGSPKTGVVPMKNYPEFVNQSSAKVDLEFELEKQLFGANGNRIVGEIPEYEFSIALNETETQADLHSYVTIAAGKDTAVNETSGSKKAIVFDGITITAEGTYVFDIKEDCKSEYPDTEMDQTIIRVTVKVMDLLGTGELSHSISYKKLDADGNQISDETVFINKIKAVDETLKVNKELSGRAMADGEFDFEASLVHPTAGLAAGDLTFETENGTVKSFVDETMSAQNQAGEVVFPRLVWKQAGVYIIEISEVDGGQADIQYDDSRYYAKVTVEEDSTSRELFVSSVEYFNSYDGNGVVSDPYNGATPVFKNHYVVTVDLRLMKRLLRAEAEDDVELPLSEDYTFHIRLKEGDRNAVTIPDRYQQGSTNDSSGVIGFEGIEINAEGRYQFEITEEIPNPMHAGHTTDSYDPGKIIATVVVGTENGVLKADDVSYEKVLDAGEEHHYAKDASEKPTTFINFQFPHDMPANDEVQFGARKNLTGRTLRDGEFSFRSELIYASNGIMMAPHTAVNDAAGTILFPMYQFTKEGTYIFKITEEAGSDPSVVYDKTVYYVQVTVTGSRGGVLDAQSHYGSIYNEAAKRVEGLLANDTVPEYNNIVHTSLTIEKISKSSGKPLAGAQFVLSYRKAHSQDAWVPFKDRIETTGVNGSAVLEVPENYQDYEYRLEEIKAPSGYSKSNVGMILFSLNQDGTIATWSNTGTEGYVEVSADRTSFIVKNHTTSSGGSGGGEDPKPPTDPTGPTSPTDPTGPTSPTEPTNPTTPELPTVPVETDPNRPGIIVPPGDVVIKDPDGNIVWEGNTPDGYIDIELPPGQYIIEVIDDQGVPLAYMMDVPVPTAGLARTGDATVPARALAMLMIAMAAGFGAVLLVRSKKEQVR